MTLGRPRKPGHRSQDTYIPERVEGYWRRLTTYPEGLTRRERASLRCPISPCKKEPTTIAAFIVHVRMHHGIDVRRDGMIPCEYCDEDGTVAACEACGMDLCTTCYDFHDCLAGGEG